MKEAHRDPAQRRLIWEAASQPSRFFPLLGLILFSIAIHFAGFTLFQVVDPPREDILSSAPAITLVERQDIQGKDLQFFTAQDIRHIPATLLPRVEWREFVPRLQPSYVTNRLALKEIQQSDFFPPVTPTGAGDSLVLKETAKREPSVIQEIYSQGTNPSSLRKPVSASSPVTTHWVLGEALQSRSLLRSKEWDGELTEEKLSLLIGIDSQGRVVYCFGLNRADIPATLVSTLKEWQFAPHPDQEWLWGAITFYQIEVK